MRVKLKPVSEQVVVVFGASSGIGRQAALDFAKKGAKIVVSARSESGLFSLVEEIYEIKRERRNDAEAIFVVADAANFDEVKAVADKAVETFGRLDTWVHSAATFLFAKFEDIEPHEFKRMVEVNLLGQVHGAMSALPHLREKGGALIHLTSVEAWRTVPYQAAYGATKHGIKGFLQVLRVELNHDKIPVSVTEIQPAAINTPIYDKGRNKMPFKPRAVPPYYNPNVVSDAVLYAAENPTRDIIAGSAGLGVMFFERLSPRLTDVITGLIGFAGQTTTQPKDENAPDSLFEPMPNGEFDTVKGRFGYESLSFDPYTFLATNKTARRILLATIGGFVGFAALKRLKSKRDENSLIG
ncbi:MAG: SDR family oxidoreductase [Pyrinomonadaceae bacterium]|nr:SDR family oxidoreductase [Pyrinomonadaceae bacterium]